MHRVMSWCVLGMGLTIWVPEGAVAAGNPVVDALAQGTVVQFVGKEAVSEPFAFEVTIATKDRGLTVGLAVGQPMTVTVAPGRTITGMVEGLEQIDSAAAQGLYKVRLVPSLERLQYRSASRTFYSMDAVQIAMGVLKESGVVNIEARITGALPKKELTIQYRETDLAFISRLLEEAGIHYHVEAGDKLVLSDANGGFPGGAAVVFNPTPGAGPSVLSFSRGQALHSGQVQAGDYNWKTPMVDQTAVAQAAAFGDLTDHLFPAGIDSKPEAQAQAAIRLAAHIAEAQICRGESTIPQLQAGQRIGLQGHPRADFNQEYVIVSVEHQRAKDYRNTFRCLPAQIPYRPKPVAAKPVVAGVVPGIVVGPAGETKFVDQYGRVKVRFPWRAFQHSALNEQGDAGFVRVGQIAAGAGSAALWLPEVGDEVLVAFEHGDPDRPVVVGSLYNGKDMPPVALPVSKHVSLFRAQAPNGQKSEMVYDGTPGNERILLNGVSVQMLAAGDVVQRAGRAMVTESAGDLTVKSGQNLAVTSQRDAMITVGANTQLNVGGSMQSTVGASAVSTVGANQQTTVGGAFVVETAKDLTIKAGQNAAMQIGRSARLTVGEDLHIQTARSIAVTAGAMFQFVASQTGTFQVGDSFIGMKRDGSIDILGKDVEVKSSGNLVLKGSKIVQN